jgi:hypothetical protein
MDSRAFAVARFARRIGAVLFMGAAAYHVLGLVRPDLAVPAPPWRHALFVAINAGLAAALVVRVRCLFFIVLALTLQQTYSHGTYAWEVWAQEHRLDWASVVVLLGLPSLLLAVAAEDRSRSR